MADDFFTHDDMDGLWFPESEPEPAVPGRGLSAVELDHLCDLLFEGDAGPHVAHAPVSGVATVPPPSRTSRLRGETIESRRNVHAVATRVAEPRGESRPARRALFGAGWLAACLLLAGLCAFQGGPGRSPERAKHDSLGQRPKWPAYTIGQAL